MPTTEFVCAVGPGQADYTTMPNAEAGLQTDLTLAGTLVYSGTRTLTLADNASVTLYRGGASQGVTATVVHCTATQILLESISNVATPAVDDQWRVDASNYFTISDTGNDARPVAECATTGAAAGASTWAGAGVDTDVYYIIRAASGHEAQQPWDSNRFRISITSGTCIYNQLANTVVENLQGECTGAGTWLTAFRTGVTTGTFRGCVARHTGAGANGRGIRASSATTVENCIAYGWSQYGIEANGTKVINCTLHDCDLGLFSGNDNTKALNVISANNTTGDFTNRTYASGTGYNCTDGTYAPGSNNQTSATINFVSTTGGSENLHLDSGGDPHDNGNGPSGDGDCPSTDFDGDSRSGGTCDIGADEYQASGTYATGAADIPAVDSDATATYKRDATGAADIPAVSSVAAANYTRDATGASVLAPVEAQADAVYERVATAAATLGAVTAAATAVRKLIATGAADIPAVTAVSTAYRGLTKVVDKGGTGDYTTLDGYEDAWGGIPNSGDCSGENYVAIAKWICTNATADTTAAVFDGWTATDATNYIKVKVDSSYRHNGTYPASGNIVRIEESSGNFCIEVRENFFRIEGVAFKMTAHDANDACFKVTAITAGEIHVSHCVMECSNAGNYDNPMGIWIYNNTSGSTIKAWNNVIYDFSDGTNEGAGIYANGHSDDVVYSYANTIVDNYFGIYRSTGTVNLYDDVYFNNDDDFFGTINSANYVGYDQHGVDPGSNGTDLSGEAGTDLFANYSGDNFHVKDTASALYDAGLTLRYNANIAVVDDIDFTERPESGSCDIGADEFIAGVLDATGAADLGAVEADATATYTRNATGAADIPALDSDGTAVYERISTGAADIPALDSVGTCTYKRTATAAADVPALDSDGAATKTGSKTATGAADIPALDSVATAVYTRDATGAADLPAIDSDAQATLGDEYYATGAADIPALDSDGTATYTRDATATATLPAVDSDGTATYTRNATGAADLPALDSDGTATKTGTKTATGAADLAAVTATATAVYTRDATGAAVLAVITADGDATRTTTLTATAAADIAALVTNATATWGRAEIYMVVESMIQKTRVVESRITKTQVVESKLSGIS